LEGLPHDEIAKRMQISVRTVESQIYKALKFLKKNLNEELLLLIFLLPL
jgi:RNA polymerase sigma-70 factor (ECF subfamily)